MAKITVLYFFLIAVLLGNALAEEVPLDGAAMSLAEYEERFPLEKRLELLQDPDRKVSLPQEMIVEAMRMEKGMKVLDFGAGSGYFTFALADALQGTGKVFATDIDSAKIDYLRRRVSAGRYENVVPVPVKAEGVDPFYRRHIFDRILLAEVFEYLPDPVSYLTEIKASLKPESGRLFLICFNPYPKFTADDILKPGLIFEMCSREGEKFPIYDRLGPTLKKFTDQYDFSSEVPRFYLEMLADALNDILYDRTLYAELSRYFDKRRKTAHGLLKFMDRDDLSLVRWFLFSLSGSGVLNDPDSEMTSAEEGAVYMLNRLTLLTVFGETALRNRTDSGFLRTAYFSEQGLVRTLELAGYRLVRSHDFLDFHFFLEFARR